jgi:hypothetical protein
MTVYKNGVDLGKVKTVPFKEISRKVSVKNFARPLETDSRMEDFFTSLPAVLSATNLRELQTRILEARANEKTFISMMGAHVIKCGLSPIIADLMRRKIITAIAMNGAGAIHDFEIALFGETSEEVEDGLLKGTFGMSEETGSAMNRVISDAAERGSGLGQALGEYILGEKMRYAEYSLLAEAVKEGIPLTVHVAIGTDVIHQQPTCDGGAIGSTTFEDFRIFCGVVSGLQGGVVLNLGSAVLLPEVFLKALCVARNLGHDISDFTSADFDMIRHYRPGKNVVERPTFKGGHGYSFTGHHEIMIPLLSAGLVGRSLDKNNNKD